MKLIANIHTDNGKVRIEIDKKLFCRMANVKGVSRLQAFEWALWQSLLIGKQEAELRKSSGIIEKVLY